MKNVKVIGEYYGVEFTGIIEEKLPNWENGSFQKSEGIHINVKLDRPLNGYKCGKHVMNDNRESIFLRGWVDGQSYHWGHCKMVRG